MEEGNGAGKKKEPLIGNCRDSETYGFWISMAGICSVIITVFLLMIFGMRQSSDIVAVIGIITSFAGTVAGLFVGQKAGSSGQKSVEKVLDSTVQASEQKDQIINSIQEDRRTIEAKIDSMRRVSEYNLHKLDEMKILMRSKKDIQGLAEGSLDEITRIIDDMKTKNECV
ncbi:MAG: hypothetical protein PWP08_1633 [Methanofollis sp.]|nr:hypothetical protein [Methanofollis sp.]